MEQLRNKLPLVTGDVVIGALSTLSGIVYQAQMQLYATDCYLNHIQQKAEDHGTLLHCFVTGQQHPVKNQNPFGKIHYWAETGKSD